MTNIAFEELMEEKSNLKKLGKLEYSKLEPEDLPTKPDCKVQLAIPCN